MPRTACLVRLLTATWLASWASGTMHSPRLHTDNSSSLGMAVLTSRTDGGSSCATPPCAFVLPPGGASAECSKVRELNASIRCSFIRTSPDCSGNGGFLNYLDGAFCAFAPNLLPLAIILYVFWLLYLFLILGTTADKFFCPNLSAISTNLRLSHNVAGVTFLAFGNGAPDVFSAVAAFSNPRAAGLAIGALFGAGVFVTTVVAGGIAIVKPFTAASRPFLRDIIFYILAIFLTFCLLYVGRIRLWQSLGYIGLYIFYVLIVVISTWIYKRNQSQGLIISTQGVETDLVTDSVETPSILSTLNDDGEEFAPLVTYHDDTIKILLQSLNPIDWRKWRRKPWYWRLLKIVKMPIEFVLLLTVPVVDPDKEDRNWKRPLNCIHVITGPLVCILTLKSGSYGLYKIGAVFPVWTVVVLVAAPLAMVVFFTSKLGGTKISLCFLLPGVLSQRTLDKRCCHRDRKPSSYLWCHF